MSCRDSESEILNQKSAMAYHKTERYDEQVTKELSDCYKTIITSTGEEAGREGLQKHPNGRQKRFSLPRRVMGRMRLRY